MASSPDTPSEPQTSAEGLFTERPLREVALACFTNAQEFYEEACLLHQHKHVRSIALAILGTEELAKSLAFTVAAFRPDELDILSKALSRGRKSGELFRHEVKHLVTHIVDGVLIWTDEEIAAMDQGADFQTSSWGRLEEYLFELTNYGLKKLIPSRTEANKQVDELNTISHGTAQSTLKDLALYVGIDSQGKISVPSQLKARYARGEISDLGYFLEKFALLPEALQDDERWRGLSRSIHSRLIRRNDPLNLQGDEQPATE